MGTVWNAEPHTRAKHQILEEYLKRWFPILGSTSEKVIYLDGFAGPGIYSKGEEGSPVIAIRTASEHKLVKNIKRVIFEFIEGDPKRAKVLGKVLKEKFPGLPEKFQYEVVENKFASLEHMLSKIEKEGAKLAPTFAFIDPFGFAGIPMNLIRRILKYERCEVMITFMSAFILRFSNDEGKHNALDDLFGTKKWRKIHEITDSDEKERFIVDFYVRQLQKHTGVKFHRTFGMIGDNNRVVYHLIFATKNLAGLKAMKRAMMKVDSRGTFRFSDRTDPNQTFILDHSDEKWTPQAAGLVYEKFKGKKETMGKVEEFVWVGTPFKFQKSILQRLEREGKITDIEGRKRKGSFPEGCKIKFA